MKKIFYIGFLAISLGACTVTNNLYVNDPTPIEEGEGTVYFGFGTGMEAKIDSVTSGQDIVFSNSMKAAPNLYMGGQFNLYENFDLRASIHLPYIVGGFGLRLGPQYSFFPKQSKVNLAIGSDLGFVVAKDSISILGSTSALDIHANGAINADFFAPLAFNFNENSRLILTPRYSFNTIFIRKNTSHRATRKFSPAVPSLALGLKLNHFYFEASVSKFDSKYYPNFGVVYRFDTY